MPSFLILLLRVFGFRFNSCAAPFGPSIRPPVNANVLTPNCSGCQSIFTMPYNEKFKENPKSVIGLMEPMVRNFVPEDMILLSMPADRFVEMANNIEGSFLDKNFKNPTGF